MKKTFNEWLKNPKKEIRSFRSSKACYLLDLNGKILKEFNNLLECARYLDRKQFMSNQFNSNSIIRKKYRVYTIDYYLENKDEIIRLNNYSCKRDELVKLNHKQKIIICDLYPNDEFVIKTLAEKMKKHIETIRFILKGKIESNPYNIRYKYPELQKLDFKHRKHNFR